MIDALAIRIIATGLTLIGFIIAFFLIDYFARRRATIEVANLESQTRKNRRKK